MSRDVPIVGLTGFHRDVLKNSGGPYRGLICETAYFDGLAAKGAAAVVMPAEIGSINAFIDRVDAVVFTGGPDIEAARYGQARGELTGSPDQARDQFEFALFDAALAAGKPILGICRGMQLINVACGGTLLQQVDGHLKVDASSESFQQVSVARDTRLHRLLSVDCLLVNSLHHQAVARIGTGLVVSAIAEDGTVEAIEHERAAILAVQWHPEKMLDQTSYEALAMWLIESARTSNVV